MNIIYPLVKTVVKGIKINIVLDEFAGLSYATERTVTNLKLAIQDLPEKVVVEGFGLPCQILLINMLRSSSKMEQRFRVT